MSEPRLYIMMRNDLVDLTPGKAMAQTAHAANQFTHEFTNLKRKITNTETTKQYNEWLKQGNGFGTTIILSASKQEIEQIIPLGISEGYECGFTFDTSYPIRSAANETFLVNALTCAYVFVGPYTENYETEIKLRELKLY